MLWVAYLTLSEEGWINFVWVRKRYVLWVAHYIFCFHKKPISSFFSYGYGNINPGFLGKYHKKEVIILQLIFGKGVI